MKKIVFIVLSLFLTMCDYTNTGSDLSNPMFDDLITQATISAELNAENNGSIELIISNNSEEDFYISEGDLPFNDDFERDAFKISNNFGHVPYIGKLIYKNYSEYDDPGDWNLISIGESRIISVYMPISYVFPSQGEYEVYFDMPVSIKSRDGTIRVLEVVSNVIDLVIDEEAFNFRPLRDEMEPCSSSSISLLNKGKNISLKDVNNAIKYLDQKKADSYYVKWFGKYTSTRFNIVTTGYGKMPASHKQNWEYSCETKANGGCNGWAAYVYKNQPYKVWVCMDYYNSTSDRNRGTLMTHESAHWNVNFGSDDYGYGYQTGIDLAKSNPDNAVNCSNNIEYYTDDIPDAGDGPVDPPDPPVDSPVIVYQHDNYGGWFASLKVDNYNINKMIAAGAQNDNISSIKVKTGYKAIVYEHKDFAGISHVITKNISSLRTLNFNDKISSIKVQKVSNTDPNPPSGNDTLLVNVNMKPKDGLVSASGEYKFWFQGDGNLVIRNAHEGGKVVWASGTSGKGGTRLILQSGGQFVLYRSDNKAIWASGTAGKKVTKVQLLDSGNLVIKNGETIIWSKPGNTPNPPDPDPDPTGTWKFVVAGDTRTNDSSHRSVLKAVKNNTPDYKLYINSGDVVATGSNSSQWNTFKNAVSGILGSGWQSGTPPKYIACPGNHDQVRSSSGLNNWNNYLSNQSTYRDKGRNFSFKYKNATFIILDADVDKDSQVSFIKNTVANAGTTWIFAVWHYPNYYSQWINALGKFDGVFFGHEHKYHRANKGSYFGITVGTGGAPLSSGASYGYLECIVNGNKMTVKYKKTNGSVTDSTTYTANNK